MKTNCGKKRAISPVIATVLLIALVVMASSMIYFIAIPMLEGDSRTDIIAAQWFDSSGDDIADVVYMSIQNVGTAQANIQNIVITISNDNYSSEEIADSEIVGTTDLIIEVGSRLDVAVEFDSSDYVKKGENIFRIRIYLDDETFMVVNEKFRYTYTIQDLELIVLSPSIVNWSSGIIAPQAVATGGFRTNSIQYNFTASNGTTLENQPITQSVDTTKWFDADGYEMIFFVTDYLGQIAEVTRTFGVDNNPITTTSFELNNTDIEQGDALELTWAFFEKPYGGAPLINQTLLLSSQEINYYHIVLSSNTNETTNYVLTETTTAEMKEATYTFTLYTTDEARNIYQIGRQFNIDDVTGPNVTIIQPQENQTLSGKVEIIFEVIDPSGIYLDSLILRFFDTQAQVFNFFLSNEDFEASFDQQNNRITVSFNTFNLNNDYYLLTIIIRDDSSNMNAGSDNVVIEIENKMLSLFSPSATDGTPGWWIFPGAPGYLQFFLTNDRLDPLTITRIRFNWFDDPQIGHIHKIEDNIGTVWLAGGTYLQNDIEDQGVYYTVSPGTGGVVMEGGSQRELIIEFNENARTELKEFFFEFYVNELDTWVKFQFIAQPAS